jgi:hypothetical protein
VSTQPVSYRIRRLRDGLFYQGPMHKNIWAKRGKSFKTRREAQRLIDDYAVYTAVNNGPLEIVEEN